MLPYILFSFFKLFTGIRSIQSSCYCVNYMPFLFFLYLLHSHTVLLHHIMLPVQHAYINLKLVVTAYARATLKLLSLQIF